MQHWRLPWKSGKQSESSRRSPNDQTDALRYLTSPIASKRLHCRIESESPLQLPPKLEGVTAWRAWRVYHKDESYMLRSVTAHHWWDGPKQWGAVPAWNQVETWGAHCREFPWHIDSEAVFKNPCPEMGFFSAKTIDRILEFYACKDFYARQELEFTDDPIYGRLGEPKLKTGFLVLGKIELLGHTIEGKHGYRSQGCMVKSLQVDCDKSAVYRDLEERYQCDVTPARLPVKTIDDWPFQWVT